MICESLKIDGQDVGLKLITPKIFEDQRGFFSERLKASVLRENQIPEHFVQDNFSRSTCGVVRGLHYQYNPAQGKLVGVARGRILDVVVDIRAKSPTYGRYAAVELDDARLQWLWVPAGFAHGFQAISEGGADVWYKVDAPYGPQGEGGICWNDPTLNIAWPATASLVSPKDVVLPTFEQYRKNPYFY